MIYPKTTKDIDIMIEPMDLEVEVPATALPANPIMINDDKQVGEGNNDNANEDKANDDASTDDDNQTAMAPAVTTCTL